MRRDLAGLRVIVTGASSGIGRALVLRLLAADSRVLAIARRHDRLTELAKQAGTDRLICFPGDITEAHTRSAALDQCRSAWGGLDALVNNAGIGALGPFAAADEQRLRQIMEVNFFAPAEFTRSALPLLRQGRQPLIVNVGSVLGHRAVPGKSEYCASKFALHGLSDALRAELRREGIGVLLVSPSTTQSEFFDRAMGTRSMPHGRFGALSADKVARRVTAAMRTGKHEIILSAGGRMLVWLDRLVPSLADWLVAHFG
jgi:short-subunit dehydrogenase